MVTVGDDIIPGKVLWSLGMTPGESALGGFGALARLLMERSVWIQWVEDLSPLGDRGRPISLERSGGDSWGVALGGFGALLDCSWNAVHGFIGWKIYLPWETWRHEDVDVVFGRRRRMSSGLLSWMDRPSGDWVRV